MRTQVECWFDPNDPAHPGVIQVTVPIPKGVTVWNAMRAYINANGHPPAHYEPCPPFLPPRLYRSADTFWQIYSWRAYPSGEDQLPLDWPLSPCNGLGSSITKITPC
jgi:hypothetical protein